MKQFVREYGQPYSEILAIDLISGENKEILKWFLASILYSKPIREVTATRTYKIFEEKGIVSPSKILKTGWHGLVSLLDNGAYTRYDFSTADRLLEIFKNLQNEYLGDLNKVHAASSSPDDLEERLKNLGKGIGDTTVSVFLRDMRVVWSKAEPRPSLLVSIAMKELGIKDLKKFAKKNGLDRVKLETALLRLGKDFLRKGKEFDIEVK